MQKWGKRFKSLNILFPLSVFDIEFTGVQSVLSWNNCQSCSNFDKFQIIFQKLVPLLLCYWYWYLWWYCCAQTHTHTYTLVHNLIALFSIRRSATIFFCLYLFFSPLDSPSSLLLLCAQWSGKAYLKGQSCTSYEIKTTSSEYWKAIVCIYAG